MSKTTFATPEPEDYEPGPQLVRNNSGRPERLCSAEVFGKPGVEATDDAMPAARSTAELLREISSAAAEMRDVVSREQEKVSRRALEKLEEIARAGGSRPQASERASDRHHGKAPFVFSSDPAERRQQIKAIRSASFEVESFASALSMLCAQLVEHPGLRDLVLSETNEALRERFEGLGELVDGRISGALSCLLSLQPRHAGLLDAAVLDHENSLAGYGADPTAPMASGEAATSPDGDTVRDATDTSSPPPAGRAG